MRRAREHVAVRVYRALVGLFPRDFRERFGAETVLTFRDALASRSGGLARSRYAASAFADVIRSAAGERAEARRSRSIPSHPCRRETVMSGLAQDVRFGFRALRRRPGFVAAVVGTLALGIGANAAVFSLVDAIFLSPVAVERPQEVVSIFERMNPNVPHGGLAAPTFRAIRDGHRSLLGVAAHSSHQVSIVSPLGPEQVNSAVVSGNYFELLGIRPALGRLLAPADDAAPGASPLVVLSHRTWVRLYRGAPAAIGATIRIGDRPFTIIGVAQANFRGTELADTPEIWTPLSMVTSLGIGGLFAERMTAEVFSTHAFAWLDVIARVRPGIDHAAVTAELNRIHVEVQRTRPAEETFARAIRDPMTVVPAIQAAALRDREGLVRFVRLMLGVVTMTLLLACANVANLLLVRSNERAHELGIRAALGAGRSRIVRQLLIESAMLAAAGGALGLPIAMLTIRALSTFSLPGSIALAGLDLALDARVLAFTAVVAIGTVLLFGLLPAWRGSRQDLAAFMRAHRTSSGGNLTRNALVAAQVALALVLLVGAALFGRSLRAGFTTDIGFDPRPLAAVSVDLRIHGYDGPRQVAFHDAVLERLRTHPEIEGAAVALHVPLARAISLPFKSPDAVALPQGKATVLVVNSVSDDYFEVMRLPLVAGRHFDAFESSGAGRVAIVSEATARTLWGGADAIGKRLTLFGPNPYIVVGVVRDIKYQSVRDVDVPALYFPLRQETGLGGISVVVRSSAPAAALRTLQRELAALDPNVPLRRPRLVGDQIDDVLMPQRFGATLLGVFAAIALTIAAIGVYGVVSYSVAQRRGELGIRIALGAQGGDIYWTVLRASLAAVAIGTVIGIGAAMAGTRALAAFLYGVSPLDAVAFVAAATALLVAAVLASLIPARRAARTDPVASMRTI
jgi:predicted permease